MIIHNIPPVFDENSGILMLGSFPSVKSRESAFFYGHPQNRFWKVLSAIFDEELPITNDEKRLFLLKKRIALWDVIESCSIEGSSDASIKNAVPNRLEVIFGTAHIERVFTNGAAADRLYKKYCEKKYGFQAVKLPSTSPANAAYSLEKLIECWKVIR